MFLMKINELQNGTKKVELEATVTDVGEPRDVNTVNGKTKVATAIIEDDTGNIALVLWGDDAEKFQAGTKIRVENGFVKEWNGQLQLSAGKFGRIKGLE